MSIVYDKPATITELLITNPEKARALEDPIRVAIIDMLSHNAMSIEEITNELKKTKKLNKAPTSIRYHVEILKSAGLIGLVRLKEAKGGGILKYYASNTKLLSFDPPRGFEIRFKPAINEVSKEVIKLIAGLVKKYGKDLKVEAEALKPCHYCNTQHFVEFLLLEILRSATVEAVNKKEFSEQIKAV